jgi:hypothetical protein
MTPRIGVPCLARLSCYWPKAKNLGGPGAEPSVIVPGAMSTPRRHARRDAQNMLTRRKHGTRHWIAEVVRQNSLETQNLASQPSAAANAVDATAPDTGSIALLGGTSLALRVTELVRQNPLGSKHMAAVEVVGSAQDG